MTNPTLSALLLALLSQAGDEEFVHPRGVFGTIHPRAADVRRDDFLVHQDTVGGARQELLALAGGPHGAAAVWQDDRDGNLALYMALVDGTGEPVGRELPLNPPRTSRQLRPAVAVGPDLLVAAAWHYTDTSRQQVQLRFRRRGAGYLGAPRPIGTASGRIVTGVRGSSRHTASDDPALDLDATGAGWLAWIESDRVHAMRLDPGGVVGRDLGAIDEGAPAAQDGLHLALGDDGRTALVWRSEKGVVLCLLDEAGRPRSALVGSGEPLDLVAARTADGGGWWLLTRMPSGLSLQRLTRDGTPSGDPVRPAVGRVATADLCVRGEGLALAVQRGDAPSSGGRGAPPATGALELHQLDSAGRPSGSTSALADSGAVDARGPFVAPLADGAVLVAWSDDRSGHPDVWYRVLAADGSFGPPRRWNSDEASASQINPAVDAAEGRAVIAWQDTRSGEPRAWARRLDDSAAFDGEEFELSAGTATGFEAWRPTVSLDPGGSFLAVWQQREPGGKDAVVVGRLFGPARRPLGPILLLDEGRPSTTTSASAIARHPEGGWLLVWVRSGDGVFARRIGLDATLGPVQPLGSEAGGRAANPAVTAVPEGGFATAWEFLPAGRERAQLRGRMLGPDGSSAASREFGLPASPQGGDLDPALAPAPQGGFLLTWTGNDGPPRDVFARWFSAGGRPRGPLLPISVKANEQDYSTVAMLADGSWVVVWEDDISGRDHLLARRIAPNGRSVGRTVGVNQRETAYVEDRNAPEVVALGDGFLVTWSDRRRSLGHDVFAAYFGPGFDARAPEGKGGPEPSEE